MSDHMKECDNCDGSGSVSTGIDEYPETSCNRCDGTGEVEDLLKAPSPAMNAASPTDDTLPQGVMSNAMKPMYGDEPREEWQAPDSPTITVEVTQDFINNGFAAPVGHASAPFFDQQCAAASEFAKREANPGSAKPSEAEAMLAMRAESDRQQAAKRGTLRGQGSVAECPTCHGAKVFGTPGKPCPFCLADIKGSATSGEAARADFEVWAKEEGFSTARAKTSRHSVYQAGYYEEETCVAWLGYRAALAAKAEQSNSGSAGQCLINAGALRQYRHNDGSEGFVFAYDKAITDRMFAVSLAERAAAPASVPEGFALVPTEINDVIRIGFAYVDAARDASPTGIWAFSHAGWRALLAEASTIARSKSAAPEVAQPAAQGERARIEKLWFESNQNLFVFAAAWGASQRQEGRRDMHETNIVLVGENCALVEKLRAITSAKCEYPHCGCDNRASCSVKARALATPAPTAGESSAEKGGAA